MSAQSATDPLWQGEPKVLSEMPMRFWWTEGYEEGPSNYLYKKATRSLRAAYGNGSSVVINNLGQIFVNSHNNTVFVVLKDGNDDVKKAFLEIMNPPEGVTVIFREGPARMKDLEAWADEVGNQMDLLRSRGVDLTAIFISENATILLGINEIVPETIDTLKEVLRDRVPPGILLLFQAGPAINCTLTDVNKPSASMHGVGLVLFEDVLNPDFAREHQIKYMNITFSPGTVRSLDLPTGSEFNLTIQIHFVSYDPECTETTVDVDPNKGSISGTYYWTGSESRLVKFNDIVRCRPSGPVKMKAGQVLDVVMTITLPSWLKNHSFPFTPPGIAVEEGIHIISVDMVEIHVQDS